MSHPHVGTPRRQNQFPSPVDHPGQLGLRSERFREFFGALTILHTGAQGLNSSLGLIGGRPQAATFPELVDNISQHSPPSPTHLHDVPNEFSRLRVTMLPLGTDSILSPIGCHNVFCMMNRNQICM
jgi:hypothetical protein